MKTSEIENSCVGKIEEERGCPAKKSNSLLYFRVRL
jgi:hypothetical protein